MPNGCRLPAIAIVLLSLGVLQSVEARAFELTGAWASQADLCKLVFTKKGNQVAFAEFSDLFGSGFIVDGIRIRGKSARCTIKSKKQEGDDLELSAARATSIINQSVHFTPKDTADNTSATPFPQMPGRAPDNSRLSRQ